MIKSLKPTTPARRQMTIADFSDLSKVKPNKRLTKGKRRISGRNKSGRLTVRHRGGGHKRRYRKIDFKRTDKLGVPGTVATLEYDPNRTSRIALVHYADGDKRYIVAAKGLKVDDTIVCGERTKVKLGNRMQLEFIPMGYKIYNLELKPNKGGSIVRSAGTSATLVGFDDRYAIVQLPSGEMRRILKECYATIGTVGNEDHSLITIGKAGRMRWMGRRPQVLGKSMNAVDHPHGGGEGHSPIGMKAPKTKWGKKALGVKSRSLKKYSDSLIIRRRTKKRRK
jgi:large subunit ribosomal protein L2